MFYNQELFAAAGVPVPTGNWTWDELLRYAHALTQPQGAYGFGLFTGYFFTIPWIWSNGGAVISADQTRSLVDQPQAQAALQWLAELRHTHAVWPPSGSPHVKARFEAGQLAMLYTLGADYQHRLRYLLYPGPAFAYGVAVPPVQVAYRRPAGSGWRPPSSSWRRPRCRMRPGPSSVGGPGRPLNGHTTMASPVKSGSGCFLARRHRRGARWRRS